MPTVLTSKKAFKYPSLFSIGYSDPAPVVNTSINTTEKAIKFFWRLESFTVNVEITIPGQNGQGTYTANAETYFQIPLEPYQRVCMPAPRNECSYGVQSLELLNIQPLGSNQIDTLSINNEISTLSTPCYESMYLEPFVQNGNALLYFRGNLNYPSFPSLGYTKYLGEIYITSDPNPPGDCVSATTVTLNGFDGDNYNLYVIMNGCDVQSELTSAVITDFSYYNIEPPPDQE